MTGRTRSTELLESERNILASGLCVRISLPLSKVPPSNPAAEDVLPIREDKMIGSAASL
jgi:hypothetical protein